jgi:putative DNA primase/helicase
LKTLHAVLGGEIVGRQLTCPGPGHSPRDRSLSVRLEPSAPDGFVVFSHCGDDFRDCRDYVRQRLGMPQWQPGDGRDRRVHMKDLCAFDIAAVDVEAERQPHSDDDCIRITRAVRIWHEGRDPRGTLAEKYLNEQRKLDLPDSLCGEVLRFHPHCPWRDENTGSAIFIPALIVAFRSIDDGDITGIHRIALNLDGTKRDRRMLGITRRTAIKLDLPGDILVIGEGVETCMAARELGFLPAWALGSVGQISSFPVIDGIKTLTILGETGKASADAVAFCTPRWHAAGRRVRVITPDDGCSDLNDELIWKKQRERETAA